MDGRTLEHNSGDYGNYSYKTLKDIVSLNLINLSETKRLVLIILVNLEIFPEIAKIYNDIIESR